MAGKNRDSNIELLRILTICGVVVLHYNGNVAFNSVTPGTANSYFLLALEIIFIGAVDLFVLISGYFLSSTLHRKAIRAVELVVQVMIFGAGKYIVAMVLTGGGFQLKALLTSMIPNNYFVTLYLTVYLISPYINKLLDILNKKQFQWLIVLSVVLFSIWPTFLDLVWEYTGMSFPGLYTTNSGGSQYGYSLINFVMMYLLGAFLRKTRFLENQKSIIVFGELLMCVAGLFVWQTVSAQTARAYCNPLVIGSAVLVFVLFRRIEIQSRTINCLAKSAFTCFLLHDFFLPHIGIQAVVNGRLIVLVSHVILSVLGIFLVCWCAWRIYSFVTDPIFGWLGGKLKTLDRKISMETGDVS